MTHLLKFGLDAMRRLQTAVVACLVAVLVCIAGPCRIAHAAMEGDVAPAWALSTVSASKISFPEAADGAPSVILFWATWCPYCKALMPYLNEIRQKWEPQGVNIFAINIKEDSDPVAFADSHDYDFVYVLNGDDVAALYAVRFTPGLFVVDANGTIVFRRKSTDLPPGKKVAEFWAERVNTTLDELLDDS